MFQAVEFRASEILKVDVGYSELFQDVFFDMTPFEWDQILSSVTASLYSIRKRIFKNCSLNKYFFSGQTSKRQSVYAVGEMVDGPPVFIGRLAGQMVQPEPIRTFKVRHQRRESHFADTKFPVDVKSVKVDD